MYKFILILIYMFFLKNFYIKIFLKSLFFNNLKIINTILIIIILIIIYYILILKVNEKLINVFAERNKSIYFKNCFDVVKSTVFLVFFMFYYVIYLRIMIFFTERNVDINFYYFFNKIVTMIDNESLLSLLIIILCLLLMYLVIYLIYSTIILFAKKNYLKLHYYCFLRSENYRKFLDLRIEFELKISKYCFYNYFIFFKFNAFKILVIVMIFYSVFFRQGDLSKVLIILPYYAIYFFFLKIDNYIIYIFKYDFDILIIESYYKNLNFLMERNEIKKKEYIKFLLSNRSKYKFQDSIMSLYGASKDVLIVETYKYTYNKKPNDFFSKIRKKNPEFV